MRSLILIVILGCSVVSMGCATKAGTGTAVGAGGGGVIGYALGGPTGLLIGAIAGGALGYAAGKSMDNEDRRRAAYALEANREMEWRNEQTGADYRVVPTGTSYHKGRECRNFEMLAHVDGKPETVNGTACRRDDGSWESIST